MMSLRRVVGLAAACLILGWSAGLLSAKRAGLDPSLYQGKEPREAAEALLRAAEPLAGEGSWELIAIGRVQYLSGNREKGEEFFERVRGGKMDRSDWERLGKVYEEAGDWEKAEAAFAKVLATGDKDDTAQAVIGALYNLHGQREKAEQLFGQSFANNPDDFRNWVVAAGSYLGVRPR